MQINFSKAKVKKKIESETKEFILFCHDGGYCEADGIVFSGDTLFYKGIGRSDLPGGNRDELNASLKFITELLPDETVIYPGHGKKSTIGYEKANNPYLL